MMLFTLRGFGYFVDVVMTMGCDILCITTLLVTLFFRMLVRVYVIRVVMCSSIVSRSLSTALVRWLTTCLSGSATRWAATLIMTPASCR